MSIYECLYDWQQSIVDRFKIKHNFGLFLKMGLGKTPLSLAMAEANMCTKCIVITLNAKALERVDQEGSWLYWGAKSKMNYKFKSKSTDFKFDNDSNEMLLINYESLFSRSKNKKTSCDLKDIIVDFIQSCRGHKVAIIIDESHKMKNLQSQQTVAINKIKRALKTCCVDVYTYLLTGTPFTTGYIDLYSQLKTLGYDETKQQFCDQFCIRGNVPGLLGWQQPIVGYKNVSQLFRLIHQYAITIETETVVKLPEQIFVDHRIPISEDFTMYVSETMPAASVGRYAKQHQKDLIVDDDHVSKEALQKRYLLFDCNKRINNPFYRDLDYDITKIYPSSETIAETSGTFWLRCRQLSIGFQGNASTCSWYDRRRLDLLETFLRNNPDNYVLFYNFTPELLELYDLCERLGYNIDVYCGECKSLIFYDKYSSQNEDQRFSNTKNIILANFASGSTGMNWQNYSQCIIFSIPLYKDYAQALARIHRIGQKNTTVYHLFYQNNWLDTSMIKSLKSQTQYNTDMFSADLLRTQNLMRGDK